MSEVTNDIDRARHHDLTVEEVRACPTFAHFTDEQAQEVIETFKLFAKIAYDSYKKDAKNDGK
jgi:hypothetical protein